MWCQSKSPAACSRSFYKLFCRQEMKNSKIFLIFLLAAFGICISWRDGFHHKCSSCKHVWPEWFFEVLILGAGPTNLPKCLSFRFCLTCISQLLCVTVRFMLANWMNKLWHPFDEFSDFCILAGTTILTQVAMKSPFLCNVHENFDLIYVVECIS